MPFKVGLSAGGPAGNPALFRFLLRSGLILSDTPDLGPLPKRIAVDVDQVRRLVASQFPHWTELPVERVANGGWDNWTFHLGSGMLVRLPSAFEYAAAVEKEQ